MLGMLCLDRSLRKFIVLECQFVLPFTALLVVLVDSPVQVTVLLYEIVRQSLIIIPYSVAIS